MKLRISRADVILHITSILERQFLPLDFIHNPFAVVISQPSAKLVVVHPRLILPRSPELGDLFRLEYLELVAVSGPVDEVLLVRRKKEVQEELPELDGTTPSRN